MDGFNVDRQSIPADHVSVCRYANVQDTGYKRTTDCMYEILASNSQLPSTESSQTPNFNTTIDALNAMTEKQDSKQEHLSPLLKSISKQAKSLTSEIASGGDIAKAVRSERSNALKFPAEDSQSCRKPRPLTLPRHRAHIENAPTTISDVPPETKSSSALSLVKVDVSSESNRARKTDFAAQSRHAVPDHPDSKGDGCCTSSKTELDNRADRRLGTSQMLDVWCAKCETGLEGGETYIWNVVANKFLHKRCIDHSKWEAKVTLKPESSEPPQRWCLRRKDLEQLSKDDDKGRWKDTRFCDICQLCWVNHSFQGIHYTKPGNTQSSREICSLCFCDLHMSLDKWMNRFEPRLLNSEPNPHKWVDHKYRILSFQFTRNARNAESNDATILSQQMVSESISGRKVRRVQGTV